MKKHWLPAIFLVLSLAACTKDAQVDKEILNDILGCWKGGVIVDNIPRPAELLLFSMRPDGSLAISVIYELGPRCRVGRCDLDVTMDGNNIRWKDYHGTLNADRDTMRMVQEQRGERSEWLFVRDPASDALMEKLPSAGGRAYACSAPVEREDGWKCAGMADVGIDRSKIVRLLERIAKGKYKDIHSMLIVRNGKLILEEYFADDGKMHGPVIADIFRDRVHHLASTTKSIVSALVGIAIDNGFIKDVEEPIHTFLPAYAPLFSEEKKKIKIKDMLTMTAGFEWEQFAYSSSDPRNDGAAMWGCGDVVKYVLQKPLEAEAGTKFKYSNGVPTVMGAILRNACGMEVGTFAEKHLFRPLGILEYLWTSYPDGSLETDGGLALRPRDLAKIGQLYLNDGSWNGDQIVSADWVRESTKQRISYGKSSEWGYGYYWMQADFTIDGRGIHSFFHTGDGEQLLSVLPELKMVLVFTGGNIGTNVNKTFYPIIQKYVLPAVSATAAPWN